jgi:hypothetical protein
VPVRMDPSNAPFSSRAIDLFQTEFEEESYATCARCSVLDTSCQKKGAGEGGQVDARQMMDADAVLFTRGMLVNAVRGSAPGVLSTRSQIIVDRRCSDCVYL